MNFDENLINEVKKHDCIYDARHPEFTNPDLKCEVWNEIGAALGVEADVCKSTWSKLRNAYYEGMKRRLKKPYLPSWRYAKQMSFLKNIPSNPLAAKTQMKGSSNSQATRSEGNIDTKAKSEEPLGQENKDDQNDLFFYNMSQAMKKLSKKDQHTLKLKFFKMAQDAEMRLYKLKSSMDPEFSNEESANHEDSQQIINTVKRLESELCDSNNFRAHLYELFEKLEQRVNSSVGLIDLTDQDRMFLLSLTSEMKQVPASSKMMLKAEIAMSLARSVNT